MVLGLIKPRTRLDGPPSYAQDRAGGQRERIRHWMVERGEILFEASCDIIGGFPGYADVGGHLDSARLRVTERYLLVGEGDTEGFGLPIRWIDGVALVPIGDREEFGLRLYYQDGASQRLFTARFRGNRLSMRSGPRAERAHLALLRAGLNDQFTVSAPADPSFTVSWDRTEDFESEKVIWAGRATAPVEIGLSGVPSDVWLTTRSLIWGNAFVNGVHRVPLSLLSDVVATTLDDRNATPTIYLGLGDQTTGHYDLPFVFDLQPTPDHKMGDRGAFLVGLRSRGVPVGAPTPRFQPWRLEYHPAAIWNGEETGPAPIADESANESESDDTIAGMAEDDDQVISTNVLAQPTKSTGEEDLADTVIEELPIFDDTESDVVLAEWSSSPTPETKSNASDDIQLSAGWASIAIQEPDDDRPSQAFALAIVPRLSEPEVTIEVEVPSRPQQPELLWPLAYAYESVHVDALAEVLAAIRDRASGIAPTLLALELPTSASQKQALAELEALCAAGQITADECKARSNRIVNLADACVRLRTLLELRDAGHITDLDIARRQKTITAQLTAVVDVR
jgi:hypothetical protein